MEAGRLPGYVVITAGNRWVRLDEHPLVDGVAEGIEVIDFWPSEYRRILDADRPLIVGDLVQPTHRRIATAVGEGAHAVLSTYDESEGLL